MTRRKVIVLLVLANAFLSCRPESSIPVSKEGIVIFHDPTPETASYLTRPDISWVTAETRHFKVFVEAGTFAATKLEVLTTGSEEAISHALSLLGEAEYLRGARLLVVGSRDRMEELTGIRPKGIALFRHDMVLLVYNEVTRPYLRHEIFHLVSINLWGEPPTWLREGSAFYADGTCLDYEDPADTIAAYLYEQGRLIPLDRLVDNFDEEAAEDDLRAYVEAGSLVGYIIETWGVRPVHDLWNHDPAAFARQTGETLEQMEGDWIAHLSENADLASSVDWPELELRGCG